MVWTKYIRASSSTQRRVFCPAGSSFLITSCLCPAAIFVSCRLVQLSPKKHTTSSYDLCHGAIQRGLSIYVVSCSLASAESTGFPRNREKYKSWAIACLLQRMGATTSTKKKKKRKVVSGAKTNLHERSMILRIK